MVCRKCNSVEEKDFYPSTWKRGNRTSDFCKKCRVALGRKWRSENREKSSAYMRDYSYKLRTACIEKYSNGTMACVCCGESHRDFLAIDHIDGKGTQHVKQLRTEGMQLVGWLKKMNFPIGFQVLCHNCNWSKHLNGVCVHSLEKIAHGQNKMKEWLEIEENAKRVEEALV